MVTNVEHFFICLMDRLYVLLEKGLFKSFAHFLFPHEDMLIDFRERGGEGEREREREREKHQ